MLKSLKLDQAFKYYSLGALALLVYFILTKCPIGQGILAFRMLFSFVALLSFAIVCCEEILSNHKGGVIGSVCLGVIGLIGVFETAVLMLLN